LRDHTGTAAALHSARTCGRQAFLLERGVITLSSTGAEMLATPEVADRYLGVGAASEQAASLERRTSALAAAMGEPGTEAAAVDTAGSRSSG
jgi:hypothetical protein